MTRFFRLLYSGIANGSARVPYQVTSGCASFHVKVHSSSVVNNVGDFKGFKFERPDRLSESIFAFADLKKHLLSCHYRHTDGHGTVLLFRNTTQRLFVLLIFD